MKRSSVTVYLRVWRTVALYTAFAATTGLACLLFIFFCYSLSDAPLGDTLDRELFAFPFAVQGVILFFFLGSLLRVLAVRDAVVRKRLCPKAMQSEALREDLGLLLREPLLLTELATLFALPLLLPLECSFYPLYFLLFGKAAFGRALQKLLMLCILWPLFFIIFLLPHRRSYSPYL